MVLPFCLFNLVVFTETVFTICSQGSRCSVFPGRRGSAVGTRFSWLPANSTCWEIQLSLCQSDEHGAKQESGARREWIEIKEIKQPLNTQHPRRHRQWKSMRQTPSGPEIWTSTKGWLQLLGICAPTEHTLAFISAWDLSWMGAGGCTLLQSSPWVR